MASGAGDNPTADHGPDGPSSPPPFSRPPSSRPARPGTRFAPGETIAERYRVVSFLGRGGMGEVYRAEDLRLDVEVALKFLAPELAADGAWLARLYAETRMAREVAHRHVCRVFDVGELPAEAGGAPSSRWSTSTARTSRRCCAGSAGCRATRLRRSRASSARGWRRPTSGASCTAISSRRT